MTQNNWQDVSVIVFAGSGDGVLSTAGNMRQIGHIVPVIPTEAFRVSEIEIATLPPHSKVLFVDLAVNNKDSEMTRKFVADLRTAGHEVVGVCDEHDAEMWSGIVSFDELFIKPESKMKGPFKSSGAILKATLGEAADEHTLALCEAADNADAMKFIGLAEIVNKAMKASIGDNARRVYMAQWFAFHSEPDALIKAWVKEYDDAITTNHTQILTAKLDLGDGIVRISTTSFKLTDLTSLMSALYAEGWKVVVAENMAFNAGAGKMTKQVSFGTTADNKLDLHKVCKDAGLNPGGFALKANLEAADEAKALGVIRALIAPAPTV
jgi:hypothetical protein